jgi:uncharacterized protein YndB with AHSA1/START domain
MITRAIGQMTLSVVSDREIVVTRSFNAPRKLVFDAYTRAEHVSRWLGVFGNWTMPVCEIDLRVGGSYRYVWRGADGRTMGLGGTFREIVPPERVVATERFDEAWYPGEAVDTAIFTENAGKTTLTLSVVYDSKEALEAALKTPMEQGMATGFDTLAEVLQTLL